MLKNLLSITAVAFIITCSSCNTADEKTVTSKTETKKKQKPSIADSYTADTLYQNLPNLLEDVSNSDDMETLLAQNWVHADDKEALEYAQDGGLMIPVRSFSLATDGSMIKNIRNSMDAGKWKFDKEKKELRFTYNGSSPDVYKLRALAADELRLTNIGIGSETILTFLADGKRHKSESTDPFYIDNNKWRIAPNAPETDEAIKERVKGCLHFFMLYYKDVIARRAAVVSFYGFPSCIKWYGGGIYLQEDEDVLKNWNECFYNEAQAKKGTAIVSKLLEKKYTWSEGDENWIKKNLFVLEQMYKNL